MRVVKWVLLLFKRDLSLKVGKVYHRTTYKISCKGFRDLGTLFMIYNREITRKINRQTSFRIS